MHLQVSARSGLDSFSAVFVKFCKGMRNIEKQLHFVGVWDALGAYGA